jgi:hypothetical protein
MEAFVRSDLSAASPNCPGVAIGHVDWANEKFGTRLSHETGRRQVGLWL